MLIEADPYNFEALLNNKRDAFTINSCLSTNKRSEKVDFKTHSALGGIANKLVKGLYPQVDRVKPIKVQCFTLSSILLALGQTEIDFFSLDVEGPELDILNTIPFDKVKIKVILLEYGAQISKLYMLQNFFNRIGNYHQVGILPWNKSLSTIPNELNGQDVIFQRND